MNKHVRLAATLLFVVFIILAAAITRFYINVPEKSTSTVGETDIVKKLESDTDGNWMFYDGKGRYGIVDSEDRIIVSPEWYDIQFPRNGKCIAAKGSGFNAVYGCIDYEGNIIVPFIYKKIERQELRDINYFIAESLTDGSFVLYDENFLPCFRKTWDKCEVQGDELILTDSYGSYTYTATNYGLLFTRAVVEGEMMDQPYSLNISSKVLLSKLDAPMIESMISNTEKYIEYAFSGEDELLSEITAGSRSDFEKLFPDDHRLISKKLRGITELHIYSIRSQNEQPCFQAAFSADIEFEYPDENGTAKTAGGIYKAAVDFTGSSENNLRAVSAGFEENAPVIPKPEKKPEEAKAAPAN